MIQSSSMLRRKTDHSFIAEAKVDELSRVPCASDSRRITKHEIQGLNMSTHFFQRVLLFLVLFSLPLNRLLVSASTEESQRSILITSSSLLEDVEKRLHDEPHINAEELANYANGLLTEKGFNYDFDVCNAIGPSRLKQLSGRVDQMPFSSRALHITGRPLSLDLFSTNPGEGACGECFSSIPALRV